MKLDADGQFVTLEGKALRVFARQNKRGRWLFQNANGDLLASGLTPEQFVRKFWMRDDFEGAA